MEQMTSTEETVIKHALAYSVSKYVSQALFVVRGLLIARLLGPTTFGFWQSMKLVLRYGEFTHLGIQSALTRELPLAAGEGNFKKANELITIGFTSILLTSSCAGIAIIGASIFMGGKLESADIACLQLVAFVLVFQQVYFFFSLVSKLQKHFYIISTGELFVSFANLVVVVVFIIIFNIYGMFIGMIISYGIGIAYLVKKCKYNFRISVSLSEVKVLVKIGFPIMMFFFLHSFFRTIDKLVILVFLTRVELGYYGISSYSVDLIFFIPLIMSSVVGPRMTEKFGQTNDIAYLKNHLFVPIDVLSYILPIITGIIFLSADLIVNCFLPMYIDAIWPIRIISIGAFFYCLSHLLIPVIVTLNKLKAFISIVGLSIIMGIFLNWMVVKAGGGITGIAAGMGFNFFAYCTIALVYVLRIYDHSLIANAKYIVKIYVPFAYSILLLIGIEMLDWKPNNLIQNIGITSVNLAIFIFFMSPVLYFFEKKTGLARKTMSSLFVK